MEIIFGPGEAHGASEMDQESPKSTTRVEGAPYSLGAPPYLVGPLELSRPSSFAYIYSYTPKTSGGAMTFPLPQPSVPMRSHLGAFPGVLPEGDSITEGFYINTIALPMKRE